MDKEKIEIPQEIQQICRDFAKVAQNHGLIDFKGSFIPESSSWGGDINFSWHAGRHEEQSNEILISSQFFVHTKVNVDK